MEHTNKVIICLLQSLWRHSGVDFTVSDFQLDFQLLDLHCCVVSLDKKLYSTLYLFIQGPVVQSLIKLILG